MKLLSKCIRFIYRLTIGRPINYFKRIGIKAARRQIAAILATWLGLSMPMTYLMTGLTTPASLTKPTQIIRVASRAGIPNLLTFGLGAPALNAASFAAGNVLTAAGSNFNIPQLASTGASLVSSAGQWFNADVSADAGKSHLAGTQTGEDQKLSYSVWDESTAPNYYRVLGPASDKDAEKLEPGEVKFYDLDDLGRSVRAEGLITADLIADSKGRRSSFEENLDKKLTGWGHNFKANIQLPTGKTYRGWFWNRSHLLADCLGGYNTRANGDQVTPVENVVTGTRMQNVGANDGHGGMAYCEQKVVNYLKDNPQCKVYYSARAVYEGDEIIPRSVIVDMKSCNGKLNEEVEVYNAAKGYTINYKTGEVNANE